jgi:prevent-host-death family protein
MSVTPPAATTTVTSRQLNQDIARAKRAAKSGPVFITHRGEPAYVLLSIEDYRRLVGVRRSLAQALSMAGLADIDFQQPRIRIGAIPPDLR